MTQKFKKKAKTERHRYIKRNKNYTIDRISETNSNYNRPGRGRFFSLSESDDRIVRLISTRNCRRTVLQIFADFNSRRPFPSSHLTIRKSLLKCGLKGRVTAKKSLFRP